MDRYIVLVVGHVNSILWLEEFSTSMCLAMDLRRHRGSLYMNSFDMIDSLIPA